MWGGGGGGGGGGKPYLAHDQLLNLLACCFVSVSFEVKYSDTAHVIYTLHMFEG